MTDYKKVKIFFSFGLHALYNFKLRNYCTTLKQLVLDTEWAHVYFLSCKQKAPENFDRFGGFTFSSENIYSSVSFSINIRFYPHMGSSETP